MPAVRSFSATWFVDLGLPAARKDSRDWLRQGGRRTVFYKTWSYFKASRQRSKGARCRRLSFEALESRELLYNAVGLAWGDTDLSYSFVPDGTKWNTARGNGDSILFATLDGLAPTKDWQREVARSFQIWAAHTNVNFQRVDDDGSPRGPATEIQGDIRIGSILGDHATAWAYYPGAGGGGDITLRANSAAFTETFWTEQRFRLTLTHEIGHALGLGHSDVPRTVMGSMGSSNFVGLTPDDIAGIQSIYGVRERDAFDQASPNDTFSTATTIQFDDQDEIDFRADLTNYADVDYYRVTVPEGADSLTIAVDAQQLSLLSPKIEVYDAQQNLVAVAEGDYGTSAVLEIGALQGGQTYTIVADGATSDEFGMGAYRLTAQLTSNPNSNSETTVGSPVTFPPVSIQPQGTPKESSETQTALTNSPSPSPVERPAIVSPSVAPSKPLDPPSPPIEMSELLSSKDAEKADAATTQPASSSFAGIRRLLFASTSRPKLNGSDISAELASKADNQVTSASNSTLATVAPIATATSDRSAVVNTPPSGSADQEQIEKKLQKNQDSEANTDIKKDSTATPLTGSQIKSQVSSTVATRVEGAEDSGTVQVVAETPPSVVSKPQDATDIQIEAIDPNTQQDQDQLDQPIVAPESATDRALTSLTIFRSLQRASTRRRPIVNGSSSPTEQASRTNDPSTTGFSTSPNPTRASERGYSRRIFLSSPYNRPALSPQHVDAAVQADALEYDSKQYEQEQIIDVLALSRFTRLRTPS